MVGGVDSLLLVCFDFAFWGSWCCCCVIWWWVLRCWFGCDACFRVCGLFVGCSFGLGGLGGLVVAYVLRLVTCYVFVLSFVVGWICCVFHWCGWLLVCW